MPVAREVLAHARTAPGRVALALGSPAVADVTYAELARRVGSAAACLASGGPGVTGGPVGAGDVVSIAVGLAVPARQDLTRASESRSERWVQTLVVLLATDLLGAVPLVCDVGWGDHHREEVLGSVQPDRRVSVSVLCAQTGSRLPAQGPVPSPRSAGLTPAPRPDDLTWAGFTSGSTGRPRAVVRSRGSWTGSFAAVTALSRTTAGSTVLVPGDLSTSLYCFGAVHALSVGATLRPAPAPSDLGPGALASDVLHVTPAQLETALDALDALDGDGIPTSRTALVGGAGLAPAVRRRAEETGLHVVAYYGAAELSFVAVDTDGTGLRPFPGVEIDVRGEGDQDHGVVWVRSPWLASGYLAGEKGPLRRSDAWATVGDLAEPCTTDGPLVLRGRGTGAIAVGAATVLPEDVETVLATDLGMAEVAVLGTAHPRWGQVVTAVVVLAGTREDDEDDARLLARLERLAQGTLSAAQRPRRWFVAPSLPRTSGGKIARAAVAEGLAGYQRLRDGPQR
ncbi:AMP-binding protein [Sanguibacter antarcticus]|uniref:Acyl-CoA synthetase (AMP-forming)/AMP-acid ligase II n=1 Tax=Sanguibacter antarcticus TaxID=372484 RepID=A0A2A9E3V7_9MICO|nr:AMP-binding protein [Sanguibacter antarcticus]PFG33638.1 acyl-CoA synthetase (AMP-forming)/AMP-acid ligase II [Sanguibacter antarcticus]